MKVTEDIRKYVNIYWFSCILLLTHCIHVMCMSFLVKKKKVIFTVSNSVSITQVEPGLLISPGSNEELVTVINSRKDSSAETQMPHAEGEVLKYQGIYK